MKQRFYLYRRGGICYLQDGKIRKEQSLETKDRPTAQRLLEIKCHTVVDPAFNQFQLKSYMTTQDSSLPKQTRSTVMQQT